jgi:hypothetical protein
MSKGHSPRPYDAERYGRNFDQIFRRDDPMRSLVPGSIREYRSLCCSEKVRELPNGDTLCLNCGLTCFTKLVEINP